MDWHYSFFFLKKRFIYLFIYLIHLFFLLHRVLVAARGIFVVVCGLLSSCGAQAPGCVGFVVVACGFQSTWPLVEVHELRSCGTWA